jgi:23S rRNA (adenine2503-C2)-methyltransferase
VKQNLLDLPFDLWAERLELGPKESFRLNQVRDWVFGKRVGTFAEMTNLPAERRARWDAAFTLRTLTVTQVERSAQDGTARVFFRALDGGVFSCVFLPTVRRARAATPPAAAGGAAGGVAVDLPDVEGDDEAPAAGSTPASERFTLCVSTQVGCAWGCVFCASGRVPFERNLAPSEILEQVFLAETALGKRITTVLFMGMGEPLANLTHLTAALKVLRSSVGFNIGARHVTFSTSGLVPQIIKLAEEAPKVNLAISLNAADDETRKLIMPKASAWPIKDLLHACWTYQRITDTRVTFEYILLKGVNDSIRNAQRLSNMLRGKGAWVNLIAYNPVPGLPYERPDDETLNAFAKVLRDRDIFVRLRRPQGTDISAGCGQLGAPVQI